MLYALVLGALFGLPGIVAHVTWGSGLTDDNPGLPSMVGFFLAAIALIGTVPAMVAATISWWVFLRRHNGSPPSDVVPYCWIVTLTGAYLLVPIWMFILVGTTSDSPKLAHFLGVGGFVVMAMGFLATVPYVAPVMYLGTWLWVRQIRPGITTTGT